MSSSPPQSHLQHTIYEADWSTWTRRIATVLLILAFVFALTLLGPILQLAIYALILAFLLFYPVRALTLRMRLPYPVSVLVVFVIYFVVFTFLAVNLSGSLANFFTSLAGAIQIRLNYYVAYLREFTPGTNSIMIANPFTGDPLTNLDFVLTPLSEFIKGQAPDVLNNLTSALPSLFGTASNALGTVTSTVSSVTGLLGNALLVHFLALLFLLEIPGGFKSLFSIKSQAYRREIAILADKSAMVWTGFFKGQIIVCVLVGGLTAFQLTVMGVPNALLVGLITAVVSLVPLLGGFISLVPIFFVPLLQGSATMDISNVSLALLVVIINLIVQQIIWNVVAPKIAGDAVNLPVPVIILGLFIGVSLGGVLGALLAAPVMGIVRVMITYFLRKIRGGDPYPDVAEPSFLKSGLFREILLVQAQEEDKAQAAANAAL